MRRLTVIAGGDCREIDMRLWLKRAAAEITQTG